MSMIPQLIKTELAKLATSAEKYTLGGLAVELELLLLIVTRAESIETELTQSALKIE